MPCSPSDQPRCSPPSLLTVLSQGPQRWKPESPPAAATKSPRKYHSHPEGPKELRPPALDSWGRPTGPTPRTGQRQETEGQDDTGLGDLHLRGGPWPELRNMQPATPGQEQGAGAQAQSKWQSLPQRGSANTSPSRERQQPPPGLD